MSQVDTPHVYINEIPVLLPSVAEVETAVPAFIGYTEKAKILADDDLRFIPKKISSLTEYERYFGISDTTPAFILYNSMKMYFANGGGNCYVVSIGGYHNDLQKTDFIRGLDSVSHQDEPALLLFPDAVHLPGNDLYEVQRTALKQAADLGDRFCILDLKFADNNTMHASVVNEFRNNIGTENLKFGAVYTPYLKTALHNDIILPPSAVVAGQYCSTDRDRGVWKTPANSSLVYVKAVVYAPGREESSGLNADPNTGKSINEIRKFTGRGVLIWGARTLAGNDNEWRYIPVRRFINMVEESVKKSCMSFVFEPNDANTWLKIKGMIENYLTVKWQEGALTGSKTRDAFFVKVGLGQTMTATDISEGRLNVEIGMAPLKPAEFIIFRFTLTMQQP